MPTLKAPPAVKVMLAQAVMTLVQQRRESDRLQEAVVEVAREAQIDTGCPQHPDPGDEQAACRASFRHFLRWWKFVNRETGDVISFAEETLFEGQQRMVTAMEEHRQVLILKAGKLGASELACAFDGWRLRFGPSNCRVHLFSMDLPAAKNMLRVVRFGMEHLPEWMRLPLMVGEAGGKTAQQLMFRAGADDVRTVVSYAPTGSAAIDQSAHHSHVDELARMPKPEDTWASASSTFAPGGTAHIVSRGKGADNYLATLWEDAHLPESSVFPIFEPYDARPRHPEGEVMRARVEAGEILAAAAWYAEQEAKMPTTSQLYYFAPRTPEEALAGGGEDDYIDIARWDACYEPQLVPLRPGDPDQVVIAVDAGVTNDVFAAVLVTRHPGLLDPKTGGYVPGSAQPKQAAIRGYKAWVPAEQMGGEVDFHVVERWLRSVILGGCVRGHPNGLTAPSAGRLCVTHNEPTPHNIMVGPRKEVCTDASEECPACRDDVRIPKLNVVCVVYDRYELRDMMQRLTQDRVVWCHPMGQGEERTIADTEFRTALIQRTTVHTCDPDDPVNMMRRHILGAKAKIPSGDDDRCRIEKKGTRSKVDLAVAASMGHKTVTRLNLRPPDRG